MHGMLEVYHIGMNCVAAAALCKIQQWSLKNTMADLSTWRSPI